MRASSTTMREDFDIRAAPVLQRIGQDRHSVKGAVLVSQDGAMMKIKKKCGICGRGDTSVTSLAIPSGCARMGYYCPKCRKNQPIEIQGIC